jgi:hypothetical protein
MIAIEPLGTEIFLPAFIIGYELPNGDAVERVLGWRDSPDYVVTTFQQAGGMCMHYPSVAGVMLRFGDNTQHIRDAEFLIRGFQAMAEDPQMDVLRRDYPVLERLVKTRGDDYTAEQIFRLERYLWRYATLPAIESGFEAFVRFQECDLLRYFADWRILRVEVPRDFENWYLDRSQNPSYPYLEAGYLSGVTFQCEEFSDAEVRRELSALGTMVGQSHPRVFFLWENCD